MITKDITLRVDGLVIDSRLYLPSDAGRGSYPTVCICHGIPSGKPHQPGDGGYPALAERICRHGFAVFIFNFRGTGNSGGNLDLPGWTRDLKAAVNYLYTLPEIDGSRLSLLGFSAGAAVSVCLAADDKRISSVIACACPTEIKFSDPVTVVEHFRTIGVIRDKGFPLSIEEWHQGFARVRPIDYIAGIAPRALLLVHGSGDETVVIRQAYKLYERAGEVRQMIVVDGAGHRLRQDERAMNIVIDWLKSVSR